MARKERDASKEPTVPATARLAYDPIVSSTDAFCGDHFDAGYRGLCRDLAGILARVRYSPIVRGKPESWASGIVRAVGWANGPALPRASLLRGLGRRPRRPGLFRSLLRVQHQQ